MARRGIISRLGRVVMSLLPRRRGQRTTDQLVGRAGEEAAASHLRAMGMRIVARNARVPMGEADIIALDSDGTHVIVEVKTRTCRAESAALSMSVRPEENLTLRKRAKLRHIASWLGAANRWERTRVDAVGVELEVDGAGRTRVRDVRHWKNIA